ncbi:MAG: alpha-glycosidase [Ardenticatenaceae bacterium]|nr:alpha-glycosidase [Ardenticatenaceae bacterium]
MNKQAIIHLPNLEDSYALNEKEAVIRLRAAQGDLQSVVLIYIDKYRHMFHDYHVWEQCEMARVASDGRYDFFEAIIPHDCQVVDYYFVLNGVDEAICYGYGGFFAENEHQLDMSFSMPAIQKDDLFVLPEWTKTAVIYQIFPDSFYRGDGADFEGWYRGPRDGDDHLGGTLQGVIDKLDYIQLLGANVIYMTPIVVSPTNHKYHISDFYHVDPRFGGDDKFAELVQLAHARGMRVLLDGVLHSTGLAFPAFQDVVRNGRDSKYWNWFLINDFPVQTEYPINYKAWGKLREMPNLNRNNPEVVAYLLDVMTFWVREFDIDGWRLDTVDDMSHTFLREARRRIHAIKPDCIISGELWYDARPWLKGDMLDSVMNYPFTHNVLAFFGKKAVSPTQFSHGLGWLRGRYPYQAWTGLWNLLSSHDTVRFFSQLDEDVTAMKLAVLFQFTYPGTPFIYAGDELGMTGHSLQCRCGLWWDKRHNQELLAYYRRAARLRQENPALMYGDFDEILVSDERGLYGFARRFEGTEIRVFFNMGTAEQTISVLEGAVDLLEGEVVTAVTIKIQPKSAVILRHELQTTKNCV